MSDTNTPQAAEDAASPLLGSDLFKAILHHEREFRNVNWLEDMFDEHGHEKPGFIKNLAAAERRKYEGGTVMQSAPSLSAPDNAELLDVIAFRADDYKRTISKLKGDQLKDFLLTIIKALQDAEHELKTHNVDWSLVAKYLTSASVLAVGVKAAAAVSTKIAAGVAYAQALAATIGAVGVGAIAAIVVVLIGFVILMLKEAREYHLVVNNTEYDLRMYEIYRNHGKVNFLPLTDFVCGIPARYNDPKGVSFVVGGLFGMSKMNGALVGADGVLQLDMYQGSQKHQTSTFLAYEVPLLGWPTGGPNGCFAKCNVGNPSAREFFSKNVKAIESGKLESNDSSGNIRVEKRIASQKGSESYAITCYDQK